MSDEDIINHCLKNLAKFKIPKTVEFIEALPRNATGKVLKRTPREQNLENQPQQFHKCQIDQSFIELHNRLSKTLDEERGAAREKRYEKGYRTARENLDDLVDKDLLWNMASLLLQRKKVEGNSKS